MKELETCDCCGDLIDPKFGVAKCTQCGEEKCVESCIPGGNRTMCTECEENAE